MKKMLFIFALLAIALVSCESGPSRVKVHSYKTDSEEAELAGEIAEEIFWYLIQVNDGSCYYTTSSTQLTSFSGVNWTQSGQTPKELENQEETEELEVDMDEIDADIQEDIENEPDSFEEAESESDSDSGDSDGGGGDSGGGDSGGGDGGGGD